ncbi:MAG: TetR family transcriptional regulator [Actinomycetota bacterium]|nr:TetR family transcriptional regulator [Actinomycetota bacterium]
MKNPVSPVTVEPFALHAELTAATRTDGRSSRWAAHRAARREELIEAAVTAIGRHGASIGMDQLAVIAGTSKPVIYRYFLDKNDLYRAVSKRVARTVLATLIQATSADPDPRELMHAGVDAYLGLLEDTPELFRFVARNPLVADQGDAAEPTDFSAVVAELIGQQLAANLDAIGLDPALAHPWGEAIGGFISAASLWWLDHRDAMSRVELADYLTSLLWGGAAGVYQYVGQKVDPRPARGVFPTLADAKG